MLVATLVAVVILWVSEVIPLFVSALIGSFLLLAIANLTFHLAYRDRASLVTPTEAIRVAADALTCLLAVIAGRIIPAFAANAIDGLQPRCWPVIEWLAVGSVVLIAAADIISIWWLPPVWVSTGILAVAALAHLVRLCGWQIRGG